MTHIIYTIQPGDTLYGISLIYGSTVQAITEANNITNPSLIYPGSNIVIPVEEERLETPPDSIIYTVNPGIVSYTVLPGDTIYRIAGRFGTTTQSILDANPRINPQLIRPGMVITITIPVNAAAIYKGNPDKRMISLTFDATYGNNQTYELLEILRNNNIKATFFLAGIWLINYPELVRAIAAEGHEIANHSLTHPHMTLIPISEIRNQIVRTDALINNIAGQDPYLFRPPFGEYNQAILNEIASLGYLTIMWTIDSLDWKNPGPDFIVNRIVDNAEPGAIVLLHQSAPHTLQALQTIITRLREKGYSFGTVTEVIDLL